MMPLLEAVDKLTTEWTTLESNLLKIMPTGAKSESSELQLKRVHGKMRLCWGDVPICDCKIAVKVEAVTHAENFVKEVQAAFANLQERAEKLLGVLTVLNNQLSNNEE